MNRLKVLSTKKLQPSLARLLDERGVTLVEQEFISIQPILTKEKWEEIHQLIQNKIEYAAFTSANAVETLKKYFHDYVSPVQPGWKIFCISGKTRMAIEENQDLGTVVATAAYGSELATAIISHGVKELAFFCGNKRREALPEQLGRAGIRVHEVIVYETIPTPAEADADLDVVLFFSPSAVESFFSLNRPGQKTVCFAIGETTADSIRNHTSHPVFTCAFPSQEAMVQELIKHFKLKRRD